MPPGVSLSDFYYLLPEIVLTTGSLIVLIADVMLPRGNRVLPWLTVGVLAATGVALVPFADVRVEIANGLLAVDQFAFFFKVLFLIAAAMTVMMSVRYLEIEGASPGEYYFLILCSTLGMMIMAGGIDLITSFIGLETMAVSFYILAGFIKPNQRSNEAAVKYFLLGAFSLGILLYGMSLMYGLSGTTNLRTMATLFMGQERDPAADAGRHSRRGRNGIQDCRRPLPHVGAGRIRGCADAGDRVLVGRIQSRVIRHAVADFPRRAAHHGRRLAPAVRGAGDRHDDHRQPGGPDAVEPEANARVLLHRARRLSAHRRGGWLARAASPRCSST